MSAIFWGLVILAAAILAAAAQIRSGLLAIARSFDARNSLLSMIGKQRATRPSTLHDDPRRRDPGT